MEKNENQSGFSLWRIVPYVLIAVIVFSVSSCFFGGDDGKMKRDVWYSFNDMPQLHIQNGVLDEAVERGGDVYFTYYPFCHDCDDLCEPIRYDYIEWGDSVKTDTYTCDCGNRITLRFKVEH